MYIDIENANGNKLGPGPLITVTEWQAELYLDRAGTFSFDMPAGDPRHTYAQLYRRVRAWHIERGIRRDIGSGIIMQRELTVGANGRDTLRISGDDLLRELTHRTINELRVADLVTVHPAYVHLVVTAPASDTELVAAYDGAPSDATTYHTIAALPSGTAFIYLVADRPFQAINVVIGATGNVNGHELYAQFFNGATGDWDYAGITSDTTLAGSAPLAHSGRIAWQIPTTWTPASADTPTYEIRLWAAGDLSAIHLADVTIEYYQPTEDGLRQIMDHAPAGWTLDTVYGHATTAPPTGASVAADDFTTYTGDPDDGASDTWPNWTVADTDDANGNCAEAIVTTPTGAAVRLSTGGVTTGMSANVRRAFDVPAGIECQLAFRTRGDGTHSAAFQLFTDAACTEPFTDRRATGITATDWADYRYRFTMPYNRTVLCVRFYAPAFATGVTAHACIDDMALTTVTSGGAYFEINGETVLEALVRLAEQTGEHFILSPNAARQVAWLRTDARPSGIRLITGGTTAALNTNPDVARITDLAETADGYALASRVYAFAGGTGAARISLREATRAAPTGYVLDTTDGYLERTAAAAIMGRIDKNLSYPDINAVSNDTAQRSHVANMLFDRCHHWLERHSLTDADTLSATHDAPRAYIVTVAKLDRLLLPGYQVHVIYRKRRAHGPAIVIDELLTVLSCAIQVDDHGLRTTELQLATVDAPPDNDLDLQVATMRQIGAYLKQTASNETASSGTAGVIVSQSVDHGKVMHSKTLIGASGAYQLDSYGGIGGYTLTFRDGVLVSAEVL